MLGTGTHTGVLGLTTSTTAAAVEGDGVTIGVQGISVTNGATGYGVVGRANTGSGSAGVLGTSSSGYGFYGYSTAGSGAGALAYNTTATGNGLVAFNAGGGSGYAAVFGNSGAPHSGNVLVQGTLTMLGAAPSLAARDAGGSLRRLYGVQSPESWFEDFGSAQLSGGSATVQLDPAFAELIDTSSYYVFPVPEGLPNGPLYVSAKTATGFTVSEAGSGAGSAGGKPGAGGGGTGIGFSYRIVAKRKNATSGRLEQVPEPPPPISPPAVPEHQSPVDDG